MAILKVSHLQHLQGHFWTAPVYISMQNFKSCAGRLKLFNESPGSRFQALPKFAVHKRDWRCAGYAGRKATRQRV
jgi:hypothetical protein